MYNLREHWMDAYLKDAFWAWITNTQRSESINGFFDGFVNSRTQIIDFMKALMLGCTKSDLSLILQEISHSPKLASNLQEIYQRVVVTWGAWGLQGSNLMKCVERWVELELRWWVAPAVDRSRHCKSNSLWRRRLILSMESMSLQCCACAWIFFQLGA